MCGFIFQIWARWIDSKNNWLFIYFIHFWLLLHFKSKYGCPISSKITKLFFILNIYPEVKRLSQLLYHYWTIPNNYIIHVWLQQVPQTNWMHSTKKLAGSSCVCYVVISELSLQMASGPGRGWLFCLSGFCDGCLQDFSLLFLGLDEKCFKWWKLPLVVDWIGFEILLPDHQGQFRIVFPFAYRPHTNLCWFTYWLKWIYSIFCISL